MLFSTGDTMYENLKGKISLVTDGAGGIDQALCRKMTEWIDNLRESKTYF